MAETSTIIVVNKGQQTKTFQVRTKHLKRFRFYLFFMTVAVMIMLTMLIRLKIENNEQRKRQEELTAQLSSVRKLIPPPPDTASKSKAQLYIEGIEAKLMKINSFMTKRGIGGFPVKDAGGDRSAPADDAEIYAAYHDYLGRMLSHVTLVPMGYPGVYPVSSAFGYRRDPFSHERLDFHSGIDLSGKRGDKVTSTAGGTVVYAGWLRGYGNCIRIRHGLGFETLYGHLSKIYVKNGQRVDPGERIGAVGSTGHSTGNHLHYEIRKNGKVINPIRFMAFK